MFLGDYNVYAAAVLNSPDFVRVIAATLPELGLMTLGFGTLSSGFNESSGNDDVDLNAAGFAIDIGVSNTTTMAAAAPEPKVWMMILLGLAGLGFTRLSQSGGFE